MATVYILHSAKLNKYYVGSCRDLTNRLREHADKVFPAGFTTRADDWTLFFSKDGLGYEQARSIERHIKSMKSKIFIENLEKYPEIINRLLAQYK